MAGLVSLRRHLWLMFRLSCNRELYPQHIEHTRVMGPNFISSKKLLFIWKCVIQSPSIPVVTKDCHAFNFYFFFHRDLIGHKKVSWHFFAVIKTCFNNFCVVIDCSFYCYVVVFFISSDQLWCERLLYQIWEIFHSLGRFLGQVPFSDTCFLIVLI